MVTQVYEEEYTKLGNQTLDLYNTFPAALNTSVVSSYYCLGVSDVKATGPVSIIFHPGLGT